jgi:hypothetical protein
LWGGLDREAVAFDLEEADLIGAGPTLRWTQSTDGIRSRRRRSAKAIDATLQLRSRALLVTVSNTHTE